MLRGVGGVAVEGLGVFRVQGRCGSWDLGFGIEGLRVGFVVAPGFGFGVIIPLKYIEYGFG